VVAKLRSRPLAAAQTAAAAANTSSSSSTAQHTVTAFAAAAAAAASTEQSLTLQLHSRADLLHATAAAVTLAAGTAARCSPDHVQGRQAYAALWCLLCAQLQQADGARTSSGGSAVLHRAVVQAVAELAQAAARTQVQLPQWVLQRAVPLLLALALRLLNSDSPGEVSTDQ
jgi:UDP-N-acetyl-D-mannosaminuronic acid transferase (WecB/TagA/CpsF family)